MGKRVDYSIKQIESLFNLSLDWNRVNGYFNKKPGTIERWLDRNGYTIIETVSIEITKAD